MTFKEQLDWLITMAKQPGSKAHAWHRAKELAACDSGLWPDMHKRLEEAMQPKEPGNEARGKG